MTYRLWGFLREEGGLISKAGQHKLRHHQRQEQVSGEMAGDVTMKALWRDGVSLGSPTDSTD